MIEQPRIIEIPKIPDHRGNLSFLENHQLLPFEIQRTYWIYDVPGGKQRGGHAFKKTNEVIIALSGSLEVKLVLGDEEKRFFLNRSYTGLYVPNMIWRELLNFSTNSVALILSSTSYSPSDYISDFDEYQRIS